MSGSCDPIELLISSTKPQTTCHGFLWQPAESPRAILMIIHGMAEHIQCYAHVAEYFVQRGYAVAGIDQLGHGTTCPDPELRGIFDPQNGANQLVEDQQRLRLELERRFPNTPIVVCGHSMGSFVCRCFLARYGQGLAAAVVMGTAWQEGLGPTRALLSAIAAFKGWDYRSPFVDGLGAGGYNKGFEDTGANTGYEWLSRDTARPIAYAQDPGCGFMFSVSGYRMISDLLVEAQNPRAMAQVPSELPILIVSGTADPVGANGRGPVRVFEELRKAGCEHVELDMVEGARHELFNETNKSEFMASLADWIDGQVLPTV